MTLAHLIPEEFVWKPEEHASFDVTEFVGWYMVNIIEHFREIDKRGEMTIYQQTRFRHALLVSHEVGCIARRERFYV